MTTIEVSKSITKGNVKKGHEIIAAFKMPAARNENEMIATLNKIISENQKDPEVLKLYMRCMPAYFEPKYTPCNGGECKCGGSNSATGFSDEESAPTNKVTGFMKDNSKLLIAAATLVTVAIILK